MERSNVNRSVENTNPSISRRQYGSVEGEMDQTEKIVCIASGALLSLWGLKKFNLLGLLTAAAGGALIYRGATGTWPGNGLETSGTYGEIDLHSRLTIDKPRAELYAYWRNLENLPNFMSHIQKVREIDNKRSKWTAKIPGGVGTIEWDAEITREEADRVIEWQSLPDAEIGNSGEVRFEEAPGGGTIVETTISYRPPAGEIGEMAAQLLNPAFEKVVKKDLKEFKKYMERGGAPKTKSQPKSRM